LEHKLEKEKKERKKEKREKRINVEEEVEKPF